MTQDVVEKEVALPKLRMIEGGRSIAARDVHAEFSSDGVDMLREVPEMAGYVVVVWNDEGKTEIAINRGKRNPYSNAMIRDVVGEKLRWAIEQ